MFFTTFFFFFSGVYTHSYPTRNAASVPPDQAADGDRGGGAPVTPGGLHTGGGEEDRLSEWAVLCAGHGAHAKPLLSVSIYRLKTVASHICGHVWCHNDPRG